MTHLTSTSLQNGTVSPIPARDSGFSLSPSPVAGEVVRIRKYPNRRLYDTSRSRHLTHEGVVALVNDGKTVQVTDSRTGTDITNIVLLQILIERAPSKLQALPSALVHRAMRSDEATVRSVAERALAGWRPIGRDTAARPSQTPSTASRNGSPLPANGWSASGDSDPAARLKAKAKRLDP